MRLEGAEVTMTEGLEKGDRLHPLQQAFIDQDAYQCGYCTSGQIVSGAACIQEGPTGSADEIREWMSGNLCRCGCYVKVVRAVEQAARGKTVHLLAGPENGLDVVREPARHVQQLAASSSPVMGTAACIRQPAQYSSCPQPSSVHSSPPPSW
ncbi:hypothetical protein GCM10023083_20760 [Streptomyces phyllanthi]